MHAKYILVIDLGTSGPKVALSTSTGQIINNKFEKTNYYLTQDGGAEQSPEEWWKAIKRAILRLLADSDIDKKEIEAISVTSQWSGTVPVDKNGKALMNALIWMDTRGATQLDYVTDGIFKLEGYSVKKLFHWLRLTGGIPTKAGKDPLAHILYIRDIFPDVYEKTYKFLEPKDYLNLRLSGEFVSTDETIILHWLTDNRDINNIHYSDKLIAYTGIDKEKLPEIRSASEVIGTLTKSAAEELSLPEGIKIIGGTPDVHSAAIGSGAVKDFEAHLYIGTSSWIGSFVPFKKTDIFHSIASLPSALKGKYLITNEQEIAGESMNFLRDNVFFHDDVLNTPKPDNYYELINQLAKKSPVGSNGLIFTPWLVGERTPVEDHTLRGGFHNLSLLNTRPDFYRSVFEGVAFNSKWLLKYVEKIAGKTFDFVNFVGGGAQSDLWCQIQADVLQREIRQVEDPILANARGAAYLAAIALGYLTIDDISEQTKIAKVYQPNQQNSNYYADTFKEYLNIYKANKKIHKRLNHL